MRTTLLYDHFIAHGGAEKVSFQIAAAIDNCKIVTAYADPKLFADEMQSERFKSFHLNYIQKNFPSFSLAWFYLFNFKVNKTEINLILSGVFSPLVLYRNSTIANRLVYFHTFPSFVNLTYKQLKQKFGFIGAIFFSLFVQAYLYFLKKSVNKANVVFSNSKSVQQRFKQLGIETKILYPPVDLSGLADEVEGAYFLSTSRLENNKRITLTLEAFAKLPNILLHVVGGGSLFISLQKQYQHCANIKFFGWLNNKEIKTQYNQCRALVCLPENEYFGLSPVEAMAAGKAVIGVAEGGLLETITDDKLGVLLHSPIEITQLMHTIVCLNKKPISPSEVSFRQAHAQQYGEQRFMQKLKQHLNL